MDTLVSTQWLANNLGEADIAIVDASAFLPTDGRDPGAEFREAHIPGARFLDINAGRRPLQPGAAHAAVGRRVRPRR